MDRVLGGHAQNPVDAVAHDQLASRGLDVDVGGAKLEGLLEHPRHQADDRSVGGVALVRPHARRHRLLLPRSVVAREGVPEAQLLDAYESLVVSLLEALRDGGFPVAAGDGHQQVLLRVLRQVVSGDVVAVGPLPQLEVIFLAVPFFVARGKRVVVFSGMPPDPGLSNGLCSLLAQGLGLQVRAVAEPFSKGKRPGRDALRADLILYDYSKFLRDFQADQELLSERPTVGVFCELDMCLYDARLALFEKGKMRGVAAIYRSTGKQLPFSEQDAILDFADAAPAFDSICGVSSYIPSLVASQLGRVCGSALVGKVRPRGARSFPALVFRTQAEKYDGLCRAIMSTNDDGLVFYTQAAGRRAVTEGLRRRGQKAVSLEGDPNLIGFLVGGGESGKRVGLYCGLPSLLTAALADKPRMRVFVADDYLMPHHYGKLRAYAERNLELGEEPCLYYSVEDEAFSGYAQEHGNFARTFGLLEFAQPWDRNQLVRRAMAQLILRKMEGLRRRYLTEERPVLTVFDAEGPAKERKAGTLKKQISQQLKGLCFCGSGKPFKECHGKA